MKRAHRPSFGSVVKRTLGVALVGGLYALPLGCGGGGFAGLAVATFGVSAIFVGFSPGSFVIDPNLQGGATLQPEDDLRLTSGASGSTAARYLVLGGRPVPGTSVRVRGVWQGDGPGTSQLAVSALASAADDNAFVDLAPLTTSTVSSVTNTQPFDIQFDLTGTDLAKGDLVQVQLLCTSGSGSVLTQSASGTTRVELTLFDEEDFVLGLLDSNGIVQPDPISVTTSFATIDDMQTSFSYSIKAYGASFFASLPTAATTTSDFITSTPPEALRYVYPTAGWSIALSPVLVSPNGSTVVTGTVTLLDTASGTVQLTSDVFTVSIAENQSSIVGITFPGNVPSTFTARTAQGAAAATIVFQLNLQTAAGDFAELKDSDIVFAAPTVLGEFNGGTVTRTLSNSP